MAHKAKPSNHRSANPTYPVRVRSAPPSFDIDQQSVAMGARSKTTDANAHRWDTTSNYPTQIQKGGHGEGFELRKARGLRETIEVTVLQGKPHDRHLLLLVRKRGELEKDRFL